MEKITDSPTTMKWQSGIWIVKISDVGQEFTQWLKGQTCPLVTEDAEPANWAYFHDYSRFINNQVIID